MSPKKPALAGTPTLTPQKCGALCSLCPLKEYGPPVWGEGPTTAKLAVVGEAPGRDEIKARRPFIGKSGEYLDGMLSKVGMPRSQVFVTNAVMCFPPGGDMHAFLQNAKKKAKEAGDEWGVEVLHPVDACRPRLFAELGVRHCTKCSNAMVRKYEDGPNALLCICRKPAFSLSTNQGNLIGAQPETVQPMGNMALLALHGVEGIMRWRGSPTDMKRRAAQYRKEVWANMKESEK